MKVKYIIAVHFCKQFFSSLYQKNAQDENQNLKSE